MAYGVHMMEVMVTLRARRSKAESKVARAAKSLELARKELADLIAAERVMADITGESLDNGIAVPSASERDQDIAKLLGTSPDNAASPAELYPIYCEGAGEEINLDTFRTALWRLQKKTINDGEDDWTVRSDNGRYWRQLASGNNDDIEDLLG